MTALYGRLPHCPGISPSNHDKKSASCLRTMWARPTWNVALGNVVSALVGAVAGVEAVEESVEGSINTLVYD